MYKILAALFFFLITCLQLKAQILPREGSKLNYRIIGFSFPEGKPGCRYKIEIAAGYYNKEDSFSKNIIASYSIDTNKTIGEVPSFGKQYTWCIVYKNKNQGKIKSDLHHFSTMIIPEVDTNFDRLRVIKSAEKYKDAYVFLDGSRVLYSMKGQPVWFLPKTNEYGDESPQVRDLKLTRDGTITFLYASGKGGRAYEINYDGTVLWKGPETSTSSKDGKVHYHHQLTKIGNGHYMVLGYETRLLKDQFSYDSSFMVSHNKKIARDSNRNMRIETIMEYDAQGEVAWSWNSLKYLKESDLDSRRTTKGTEIPILHMNAFFFDQQSKEVYLSLKGISRIIKLKYPEGTITGSYGRRYEIGNTDEMANNLFCGQHCCRHSDDGYIYLFNNNDCNPGSLPKIIKMEEPVNEKDSLKKIWEYECTLENKPGDEKIDVNFNSGGSVLELPDHSLLACMGDGYGKVFIVSIDKKILWSALPERRDTLEKKWNVIPQYRASIICNNNELQRLIWHEEIPVTSYLQ